MKIDVRIIDQFEKLQADLPKKLDKYGVTKAHIYQNLGIHRLTFEKKLKNKSFTVQELWKIAELING